MKKFVAAKTITLSVSGMTCAGCAGHVEKALQKVEGVEKMSHEPTNLIH